MYFLPKKRLIKSSTLSTKGVLIVCLLFSPMALASICLTTAPASTPTSHFTDHNDGTVTHKTTGLMWKVCSEGRSWAMGSCSGTSTEHTWDLALQIPEALNHSGGFPFSVDHRDDRYANYTDWRLPNLKELQSIVEFQCYSPAINQAIFSPDAILYWSSTPYTTRYNNGEKAWGVDFRYGHSFAYNRIASLRVRLVRDGQ